MRRHASVLGVMCVLVCLAAATPIATAAEHRTLVAQASSTPETASPTSTPTASSTADQPKKQAAGDENSLDRFERLLGFLIFAICGALAAGVLALVHSWHKRAAELIRRGGTAVLHDVGSAEGQKGSVEVLDQEAGGPPTWVVFGPTKPEIGKTTEYMVCEKTRRAVYPDKIESVTTVPDSGTLEWKQNGRFAVAFSKPGKAKLNVELKDSTVIPAEVEIVTPQPATVGVPIILGRWGSLVIGLVGAGGILTLIAWGTLTETAGIALGAIFGLGAALSSNASNPTKQGDPPAS